MHGHAIMRGGCASLCRVLLLLLAAACQGDSKEDDGSASNAFPDCAQDPSCIGCFGAATPILTPQGPQPIESLEAGDAVLAYDESAQRVVVQRVTQVRTRQRPGLGTLRMSDGRQLAVTPEHPFYVGGGYRPISELEGDEHLFALDAANALVSLADSAFVPAADDRLATVYDLSVSGTHNYFAAGVLVHNKTQWGPCDRNPAAEGCPGYDPCSDLTLPPDVRELCAAGQMAQEQPPWSAPRPCLAQSECPTGVCECAEAACIDYGCTLDAECAQVAQGMGFPSPELAACVGGLCWFDRLLGAFGDRCFETSCWIADGLPPEGTFCPSRNADTDDAGADDLDAGL